MITLEYWWVLFLLPVPLLVRWLLSVNGWRSSGALQIPYYSRIAASLSNAKEQGRSSFILLLLAALIWVLLVIASANPVWLGEPIALPQSGRALMLAVDLSGSMNQPDMVWSGNRATRIAVVKHIANAFINARAGDRLGLILFGSNAYLQAPLTYDRHTVMTMLDDATVGLAGERTAIGDAIGLAIKNLQSYPDKEKIVVLLTDGSNNAGYVRPEEMISLAKDNRIRFYTIGLGANQMQVDSILGPITVNAPDDLDEKILEKLANESGGMFFRAKSAKDLTRVYEKINQLEPVKIDQTYLQPKTPLYPWLLAAAFVLLLIIRVIQWR